MQRLRSMNLYSLIKTTAIVIAMFMTSCSKDDGTSGNDSERPTTPPSNRRDDFHSGMPKKEPLDAQQQFEVRFPLVQGFNIYGRGYDEPNEIRRWLLQTQTFQNISENQIQLRDVSDGHREELVPLILLRAFARISSFL